jgi:TetR/AcrR family transcriptional regulator, mexJK operon transcriptional repressor
MAAQPTTSSPVAEPARPPARPPAADDGREPTGRSERKRRAILAAAEEMFLRGGYLGTNMDELAARSQVSKQTIYKHFGSKEALFVELVTAMTDATSDRVHQEVPEPERADELASFLERYAERQLAAVMTPRLLQLRRLVIGEVERFPELAEALYERGPRRAITAIAAVFDRLAEPGLLDIDDSIAAATQFNWLVMGEPLNRAMLLGDAAIPAEADLRAHAAAGVRVFLAAYRPH